jgi:cysteine desulfurase
MYVKLLTYITKNIAYKRLRCYTNYTRCLEGTYMNLARNPIYLDCNATTPLEQSVIEMMRRYLVEDYGNAGSRTHQYGLTASKAVERARSDVASVVNAQPNEVIFTSGATEANNISLLGLASYGAEQGKRHIVTTAIEHKAVLEPLEELARLGFSVTVLPPNEQGFVEAGRVYESLRSDTLLVSVMQVNNETGVEQPLSEIAEGLANHAAYFHVDGAQGFGKSLLPLAHLRLDLISLSGHKIYGPKGVGALITRRRSGKRPPLKPLFWGGGQESGLRPGTLPVHLIAGFGQAAALAEKQHEARARLCATFKERALAALLPIGAQLNGEGARTLPHVVNLSFPGVDSEALIVALKDLVAISNGSACTSHSYAPSHVLRAMGLSEDRVKGAVRLSWCHMTEDPDWQEIGRRIAQLT